MRFSNRTPGDISPNPIAKGIEKASGGPILDLTESNPTRCGFDYPAGLLKGLSAADALNYAPFPFGLPRARQAVADYLTSKGQTVDPDKVVLTSSTSEAYSFLFKLLGDSGSAFLVPTPGYPLLEHLLHLEGMELAPYPFKTAVDWPVDLANTARVVHPGCRGLVVVNPNNPTGAFLSEKDQEALGRFCAENELAYISDEVFADYAYPGRVFKPWVPKNVPSFRLGGLSKSLGLPQLKLSWIVLDGPAEILDECRERLELVADAYLSLNTPVQLALGDLLNFAPHFQRQMLDRVLENREFLQKEFQGLRSVRLWPAQGGWYALVEVLEKDASDEKIVLELLENRKVLVQPGVFYDFPEGCFLVLSLLPQPKDFQEGVKRLGKFFES